MGRKKKESTRKKTALNGKALGSKRKKEKIFRGAEKASNDGPWLNSRCVESGRVGSPNGYIHRPHGGKHSFNCQKVSLLGEGNLFSNNARLWTLPGWSILEEKVLSCFPAQAKKRIGVALQRRERRISEDF